MAVVDAKSAFFDVLRAEALLRVARDAVEAARRECRGRGAEARGRRFAGRQTAALGGPMLAEDERALVDAENAVVLAQDALAARSDSRSTRTSNSRTLELSGGLDELRTSELLGRWSPCPNGGDSEAAPGGQSRLPGVWRDVTTSSGTGVTIARGALLAVAQCVRQLRLEGRRRHRPGRRGRVVGDAGPRPSVFTSFKNLSDYQQSRRGISRR